MHAVAVAVDDLHRATLARAPLPPYSFTEPVIPDT
jgi:hypothetical protein